jgi:hypothetical protein
MGLSIKDPETERLVRLLAERRRTGVTGAIRLAVSDLLARDEEEQAAEKDRKLQAIRDIQRRYAEGGGNGMTAEEVDAWMYDENGLPH